MASAERGPTSLPPVKRACGTVTSRLSRSMQSAVDSPSMTLGSGQGPERREGVQLRSFILASHAATSHPAGAGN
jgi:hypothetical protein